MVLEAATNSSRFFSGSNVSVKAQREASLRPVPWPEGSYSVPMISTVPSSLTLSIKTHSCISSLSSCGSLLKPKKVVGATAGVLV